MEPLDPIRLVDSQEQFDVSKSGIYMIYCPSSKRAYIGQSNCIKKRWNAHKAALKKGTHYNRFIQRTYDKYNGNLCFYILENTDNRNTREEYWASLVDKSLLLNEVGVGGVVTDLGRVKIKPEQYEELRTLYRKPVQIDEIAKHFGISRRMTYKYLKMIGESRTQPKKWFKYLEKE